MSLQYPCLRRRCVSQRVKKDTILLRLDTAARAADVESAKAQLTMHARLLDEAQRELSRSQELFSATLAQAESDLKYSESERHTTPSSCNAALRSDRRLSPNCRPHRCWSSPRMGV